ncbi:sterol transporter Ecym_5275 [Eremothecium cymbalariae DBVPG|uniref:Phosphatidylglycerol/phosphatidylinositol transfer protein n=1 Tax=Eremothecium cymbalariae (strain CBS 270.75 / DBVPG 7215 / KCTC 17166 / NRRL Y-17582) TaxID=931890 RepID=I6ND96_ERECY|nr:hypothetical protein Ecym_5275 [Eremothecium cymbalariae DBVPG\
MCINPPSNYHFERSASGCRTSLPPAFRVLLTITYILLQHSKSITGTTKEPPRILYLVTAITLLSMKILFGLLATISCISAISLYLKIDDGDYLADYDQSYEYYNDFEDELPRADYALLEEFENMLLDSRTSVTEGFTKPIPGDSPLEKCDLAEEQSLEIHYIDLTPNPPERGANLTIDAEGVLYSTVDEGSYVMVEVRLGYIKLLTQTFDLCEQLEENDLGYECPLLPGTYTISETVEIPVQVPPGKYTVQVRAFTGDDQEVACLTGNVLFPPV